MHDLRRRIEAKIHFEQYLCHDIFDILVPPDANRSVKFYRV